MSPRAACRLATLGFEHVYDYMPGKVDWLARGLAVEGDKAAEPRAIDVARRDVVTCELHTTVGDLRDEVARSPYGFALVLGPELNPARSARPAFSTGAEGCIFKRP